MKPMELRQTRIDELELLQRVKSFLAGRHYSPLRNLRVQVLGDSVIVSGIVSSFHERQVAIECCKRVAGVRHVVDEVTVNSPRAACLRELDLP